MKLSYILFHFQNEQQIIMLHLTEYNKDRGDEPIGHDVTRQLATIACLSLQGDREYPIVIHTFPICSFSYLYIFHFFNFGFNFFLI